MIEKKNVKKLAWVAVALVIMVLSMTVVSKAASNPENHKKTIEALDEKKADILKTNSNISGSINSHCGNSRRCDNTDSK